MSEKAEKVRTSSKEPEWLDYEIETSQESYHIASQESGRLLSIEEESRPRKNLVLIEEGNSGQRESDGSPILFEYPSQESGRSTPILCLGEYVQVISSQESEKSDSDREESVQVISSQESGQFSPFVRDSVFNHISTQQLEEHSFSPISEHYCERVSLESLWRPSQETKIYDHEDRKVPVNSQISITSMITVASQENLDAV